MKTKQAIRGIILLSVIVLFFATGCGSKKTVSQTETKEKTDVELTDNSTIVTDITQEQQLVNTSIKERIVTMYGFQMVPVYVDGDTIYTPVYYPLQSEEEREILISKLTEYLQQRDSIQNAIELELKGMLEVKDKQISEIKESKIILHIAISLLAVLGIIVSILYIRARSRLRSLGV